jgi:transcription elongation GreA/GreB family factor
MLEPSKKRVFEQIRARLKTQIVAAGKAVEQAHEGFRVGDERADNRGERGAVQERSWLLAAQGARLEVLKHHLFAIENTEVRHCHAVGPGALLTLQEVGAREEEVYLIHPELGGEDIEVDGMTVTIVSPSSPLGAALLNRKPGEEVDVHLPGGSRRLRILKVF